MATLISAYNPRYSQEASILTGNPDRVTVEVEASDDVMFWKDLLCELCPQKEFHFDPYQTIRIKDGVERTVAGKARIMQSAKDFNKWYIGCVDSDYDWLLSDYTEEGKTISSSEYLLQTYAYSIENLLCYPSTLGQFCDELTEEHTDFDFDDYVNRLSQIIYPLLIWSVYLHCNQMDSSFSIREWHQIIVNEKKDAEESLRFIENKAKEKMVALNKELASKIAEKDGFGKSLTEKKNLTPQNAYLYVRGHELFNHLLNSVLDSIICSLRQQHYATLKETIKDEDSLRTAQKKYQKKQKSIEDLLYKNYRYKRNSPIYEKIKDDATKIWE